MHPPSTPMRRFPARLPQGWFVVAMACTALAGCANPGGGEPAGPGSAPSPSTTVPASGGPTSDPAPDTGPWGAYSTEAEACAAVAGHVLTLSVLPSSLRVTSRVADVQRVEDEVATMVATAPDDLVAELSRIQLLVDTYGEELAAEQSPTTAPTAAPAQLNTPALEESLEEVRGWLTDSCTDPANGR